MSGAPPGKERPKKRTIQLLDETEPAPGRAGPNKITKVSLSVGPSRTQAQAQKNDTSNPAPEAKKRGRKPGSTNAAPKPENSKAGEAKTKRRNAVLEMENIIADPLGLGRKAKTGGRAAPINVAGTEGLSKETKEEAPALKKDGSASSFETPKRIPRRPTKRKVPSSASAEGSKKPATKFQATSSYSAKDMKNMFDRSLLQWGALEAWEEEVQCSAPGNHLLLINCLLSLLFRLRLTRT